MIGTKSCFRLNPGGGAVIVWRKERWEGTLDTAKDSQDSINGFKNDFYPSQTYRDTEIFVAKLASL